MKSIKLVRAKTYNYGGKTFVQGKINMISDDLAADLLEKKNGSDEPYFEVAKEDAPKKTEGGSKSTQTKKAPAKQSGQTKKQSGQQTPEKTQTQDNTQSSEKSGETGGDADNTGGVEV